VATVKHQGQRNAVGAHGGSYCVYTALAVAAGELDVNHVPQLDATVPTNNFGPFPSWRDPTKLVTIDPWGHMVKEVFDPYFKKGYDIRPTIAVTKAHIDFPEVKDALRQGRLRPDGHVLKVRVAQLHDRRPGAGKSAVSDVHVLTYCSSPPYTHILRHAGGRAVGGDQGRHRPRVVPAGGRRALRVLGGTRPIRRAISLPPWNPHPLFTSALPGRRRCGRPCSRRQT
jgi:hypothetical protein